MFRRYLTISWVLSFLLLLSILVSPTFAQMESSAVYCPQCGEKNDAAARFCSNCGTTLPQPVIEAAPPGRIIAEPGLQPAAESDTPQLYKLNRDELILLAEYLAKSSNADPSRQGKGKLVGLMTRGELETLIQQLLEEQSEDEGKRESSNLQKFLGTVGAITLGLFGLSLIIAIAAS